MPSFYELQDHKLCTSFISCVESIRLVCRLVFSSCILQLGAAVVQCQFVFDFGSVEKIGRVEPASKTDTSHPPSRGEVIARLFKIKSTCPVGKVLPCLLRHSRRYRKRWPCTRTGRRPEASSTRVIWQRRVHVSLRPRSRRPVGCQPSFRLRVHDQPSL